MITKKMDDCTLFSDTSKCCLNIFFALVSFLDFQHEIRGVRVYKAHGSHEAHGRILA